MEWILWSAPREEHLALIRAHRHAWTLINAGFTVATLDTAAGVWAKTSDAGRHAIAEAVFERIDVLG
ncbi:MAG: hypothetical protein ABIQ17_07310 [Candidatus Limnocylindrales bacterium]